MYNILRPFYDRIEYNLYKFHSHNDHSINIWWKTSENNMAQNYLLLLYYIFQYYPAAYHHNFL